MQIGIGAWLNERGGETRITLLSGGLSENSYRWGDEYGNWYNSQGRAADGKAPNIIAPWEEPAKEGLATAGVRDSLTGGEIKQIDTGFKVVCTRCQEQTETLHDKYVMAALTGLASTLTLISALHVETAKGIVHDAILLADEAMEARKK